MIEFLGVSKRFPDGTQALSDISFEISDGEFVFIIGPSGAGKTTILRLITRDLPISSGKLVVEGKDLTKIPDSELPKFRRTIGTVFQDYKLLPDRTVFENVALSLEILGKSEAEILQAVKDVLREVGLEGRENYFPVQLSGGELQRTAIARAVVGQPSIILADEPTADLDPATEWQIIALLEKINKGGKTVVMATHKADVVNAMGRRVIQLEKGKIIKDMKKGRYAAT